MDRGVVTLKLAPLVVLVKRIRIDNLFRIKPYRTLKEEAAITSRRFGIKSELKVRRKERVPDIL